MLFLLLIYSILVTTQQTYSKQEPLNNDVFETDTLVDGPSSLFTREAWAVLKLNPKRIFLQSACLTHWNTFVGDFEIFGQDL